MGPETPFKISSASLGNAIANLATTLFQALTEEGHPPEVARAKVVSYLRITADIIEATETTPSDGEGERQE